MPNISDIVNWQSIKEHREKYFVEYDPANTAVYFASAALVFLEDVDAEFIAVAMEKELALWLSRYPIPIMLSSVDIKNDLIDLCKVRSSNHLMGFIDPASRQTVSIWGLMKTDNIPAELKSDEYRQEIYAGLKHKTREDIRRNMEKERKVIRTGWLLVFFWAVIIPATIAIIGWASPKIAVVVLVYSLGKAGIQALKLTGKWKKFPMEKACEDEDVRMKHHHYYCERNPEGFQRLMAESIEKDEIERNRKESEELKFQQKG